MNWHVSNLYEQTNSQELPVDGFAGVENASQFSFMQKHKENSHIGYFLEVDVKYPE